MKKINVFSLAKIILLLGILLLHLHILFSGDLGKFIDKKLGALPVFSIVVFSVLLVVELRNIPKEAQFSDKEMDEEDETILSLGGYSLFLIPIVLGLVMPRTGLNVSALSGGGAFSSFSEGLAQDFLSRQEGYAPENISAVVSSINIYPEKSQGRKVGTIGFVWHKEGLSVDEFILARYMITCCVAHTSSVKLLVNSPQANQLRDNEWVKVEGIIEFKEDKTVYIQAKRVVKIPEPDAPYLYR